MPVQSQLSIAVHNAHALAAGGDCGLAREALGQALDRAIATIGADHPDVLSASRVLADLHMRSDDPLSARRLLEEAFMAGQNGLGDSHPLILGISYDLARLAASLDNLHEARRNYRRVATHGPQTLGENHEYVTAALAFLGPWAEAGPAQAQPAAPAPEAPPAPTPRPPDYADQVYRPVAPPMVAQGPFPAQHHVPAPAGPPAPVSVTPISVNPISAMPVSAGMYIMEAQPPPRSRMPLVLGMITILALLIAAGALAFAFWTSQPSDTTEAAPDGEVSSAPSVSAAPPTDLTLSDQGSSVTLVWTDPAGGTAQFIVAAGQGTDLTAQHTTWETSFTLNGLNPKLDYCFTVAAVYDAERVAVSDLVCTQRADSSPSASTSSPASSQLPSASSQSKNSSPT